MAGIYFHIPFCKQACHYCDFHFSTSQKSIDDMSEALLQETFLRKKEISKEPVSTIYFGGGTPSLLKPRAIESLISAISIITPISENVEITLEANPDDLNEQKLIDFKSAGINRLSIGTQSFDEKTLTFLNRAHNAVEAKKSLELAKKYFSNLSIDLIYGIETQTDGVFEKDLTSLLTFDPEHISAYSLTIEGNNAFAKWVEQGKMKDTDDELAIKHFNYLLSTLKDNGYEQYEISNFSKKSFESKHNTSYWFGKSYIGIGPSAHSFNGSDRSWNIANNAKYIHAIEKNELPSTFESLTPTDHVNEYFMTRLRTVWGCDFNELKNRFGFELTAEQSTIVDQYIKEKKTLLTNGVLTLTEKGKLIADKIASDLFITD